MPVQPGSSLGPYQILDPIGEGGMGEVWRARDTRLDREVAIKILPPAIAASEQALARFEREARLISSMSHPNICTLFDVGHEGETHFLVMELIDGESLSKRLERGPLPAAEVMRYGAQIADALDRAHKQGVVHRDLKPGNVMLTKDGAKLLDFGLARPIAEPAVQGMTQTATQAAPLTAEGTIVGTFQYMAPEQLEGQETDARTDIFALGALLYEMATGRPAFDSASKTSLIAAIVTTDPPPISTVQATMPPALDNIVRTCLRKHPDDRWQNAHDVATQLRWVEQAGSQAGVAAAVVSTRRKRRNLLALAAAVGWVGVAVLAGWLALRPDASGIGKQVLRTELVPPAGVAVGPVVIGHAALSPDGDRIAMIGNSRLVVRDLATGEFNVLEGTEGAQFPFWSPDGAWLAFFSGKKLKKVESTGGPVQILADAHAGRGGTWSETGTLLFAPDIRGPLVQVPENGGTARPVTSPASEAITHRMPHFLPDGRSFLLVERESREEAVGHIAAASLADPQTKVLIENASNPQYADGYLFFVRDGNLMAQRFDPARLTVDGSLIPLAESIEYYNPRDIGNYSVSSKGTLVYRQRSVRQTQLGWFDFQGAELETVGEAGYFSGGRISRDGRLVAIERRNESQSDGDIWIVDLRRGQLTRSTFASVSGVILAVIAPDGDRLAVSSFAGTGWAGSALWIQPLSGSGTPDVLLESTTFLIDDWSSNGRYLVGQQQETETAHDVVYIDLQDAEPKPEKLVSTRYTERQARLSPDARWIAYVSDETGRGEVYLSEFPEAKRKWQISTSGGSSPQWSADGSELMFAASDGIFAVPIAGEGAVQIGSPRLLLDLTKPGFQILAGPPIVVEDERFLALRYTSDEEHQPFRLILNWRAALER